MNLLRERMRQDLSLHGYSETTRDQYIRTVAQLCAFHKNDYPQRIGQEGVREYFLHLKDSKKCSNSTFKVHLAGIRFFYETTLGEDWLLFDLVRPGKGKKQPVVLNRREVRELLGLVRDPRYRMALTVIYSCGLRHSEGLCLQAADIDGDRRLIHVRAGKGGRDRHVPLPSRTLQLLRDYWREQHLESWLFPSPKRPGPISKPTLYKALRAALGETSIAKSAHVHTLRHSYATHLLDRHVPLSVVQAILGHRSIQSTLIYTHLTSPSDFALRSTLDELMGDL